MTELVMPRRKFLTSLLGLIVAPAIVKASNLMPIKVLEYGQWKYTEFGLGFSITLEEIGDRLWDSQMVENM